jgi:hypothetical protein
LALPPPFFTGIFAFSARAAAAFCAASLTSAACFLAASAACFMATNLAFAPVSAAAGDDIIFGEEKK